MSSTFDAEATARQALARETALALGKLQVPTGRDRVGLRARAERLTDFLIDAMFPRHADTSGAGNAKRLELALALLELCLHQTEVPDPYAVAETLFLSLPELCRQLSTDLEAAYRGDPAAASLDEILLCYPAFRAIATYRLAHILYQQSVPLLPRIMAEYAHRRTGIDIHPGASIGDHFFIDHGTGVVIGETAAIGHDVKLYQHVTIGAKSFELGPDGALVKGVKRHPDIGNRVVIYAGATILGGDTQIGDDCTIGGSVWLTHSVPAGTLVLARPAVTTTQASKSANP
ncbi:MAG: serine acetyltransferase [Oscillospiraceae bacterium]|nr:serine acetyltransferase [Oscillospiraceae bacterium]